MAVRGTLGTAERHTGTCRRCQTAVEIGDEPADRRLGRCDACGWWTSEPTDSVLDLAPILDSYPDIAAVWRDVDEPSDLLRLVRDLFAAVVDELAGWIRSDRSDASAWLYRAVVDLHVVTERPSISEAYAKRVQLVHTLVELVLGHWMLVDPADAVERPTWKDRYVLAATAQSLMSVRRELELGASGSASGAQVFVADPPEGTWAGEVNANISRHQGEPVGRLSPPANALVLAAERQAHGFSVSDVLGLLHDHAGLRSMTRVRSDDELLLIDAGPGADPGLRSVLERFTFTTACLRHEESPTWFGGRQRSTPLSPAATVEASATADWLHYRPLLAAAYLDGAEPVPALLTTRFLLFRMLARSETSVAFRLDAAVRSARAAGPKPRARAVARLAQRFHKDFEQRVADEFTGAGMRATASVSRIGGRGLACGEIDVIAVGEGAEGLVAVVCETKNSDLSFYKDHGPGQAMAVVRRAGAQAGTKARWAHDSWSELAPALGADPAARPLVVAMIVTRSFALPVGPDHAPVVAHHELAEVVPHLLQRPAGEWRPDLRRGVV